MATRDVRNFKFLKEAIIQKFRNPETPSFKGIRYEPVANPNSIFGRIYTTFREFIDKKHLDLKQYLNIGDKSVLNRLYLNLKKDSNLKFLDDPDSTLNDQKYELSNQYFQEQSKDVTAAQQAEPVPVAHAGMPGVPAIAATPSQPRFVRNIPQSLTPTQTESTNTPTEKAIKSDGEPIKPEVPQAFQKAFESEPADVLHPNRQPVPETFNKTFENEPPLNPDKQTSLKTNPFTKTSAINPGVRFQSGPSDIFKTTGSKTGTFFKTNSNRVAGSLGDIFKGIGRGIAGPGVSGLYYAGAKLGNGGLNAIERLSKPGGAGGGGGIGKLSKSSNKLALGFLGIFFLIVLLGGLFGATSGTTPTTGTIPTTGTASSCLPVGDPNGYIQKVGFLPKNDIGYSFANPANYSAAYTAAAQKAKAAATNFSGVDPVLLVWWVFFETGAKYDSYSYSNCLDNNHDVNTNCSSAASGRWQLGYGQQYATIGRLVEAFQKTHGDPTDANLTQQVGQNVLNQAGQTSHTPFPNTSVNALLADTNQDAQYWKSVLMRDPDISMYLLAYVFSSYAGQNLREITAQWGSYYTEMWQKASNLLSDILAYNQTNCQAQSQPAPAPNGDLRLAIRDRYHLAFDESFDQTHLLWAWQVLAMSEVSAPQFLPLLKQKYSEINVGTTGGIGARVGNTILFSTKPGTFFSAGGSPEFQQILVHELGHIIHGTRADNTYTNQMESAVTQDNDFLTGYAQGATAAEMVCATSNSGERSVQLDEDFAESVAYYISKDTPELNYSNVCPPKNTQNPFKTGKYPNHLSFIKQLLGGNNF